MQLNNDIYQFINHFFEQLKERQCENINEVDSEKCLEEKNN